MVPFVDKYRRYTAYRLEKARGQSEAILSTMFSGGESYAASVEQQGNSAFVKSRASSIAACFAFSEVLSTVVKMMV
jgi:hypothetical protein